jgi:surface protein
MKCRNEYTLYANRCIEYSLVTSYYTDEQNLIVKLINIDTLYIDKIIFDGQILNSSNTPAYNNFPNIGYHHVNYIFKNNLTSFSNLFYDCKNLVSVNFASNIKTRKIVNLANMFGFCTSLISIEFSKFDTFYVTDMSFMFDNCYQLTSINLTNFRIPNVITMYAMFRNCTSLKTISRGEFNTQNVTTFAFMFHNCSSLTSIILPNGYYISKLKYTNNMFSNCVNLSYVDLTTLDFSLIENTESMFEGCSSLVQFHSSFYKLGYEIFGNGKIEIRIPRTFYYYINRVKYMKNMFKDCISLTQIDISNWNLTNVVSISEMLRNCFSLRQLKLGEFYFYNAISMNYLFSNCNNLENINLTAFKNTNYITSMSHTFENCKSLEQIDLSSLYLPNLAT